MWKAIQQRLLAMDAVKSEGAFPSVAKHCNAESYPGSQQANSSACWLSPVYLPKRTVGP